MNRIVFVTILSFISVYSVLAQFKEGNLSGSLETINHRYKLDDKEKKDNYGSNSYLKLDYTLNKISMGLQYEAYLPALVGPYDGYKDSKIATKYLTYKEDLFEFTIGNFYEQFGSGLLFRTYEARAIGLNNAMEGARFKFRPFSYLDATVIYGKQRKQMSLTEGKLRGLDANLSLMGLLNTESDLDLIFGGSYLSKYQDYTGPEEDFPSEVTGYSARVNLLYKAFQVKGEYVEKSKDPSVNSFLGDKKGNALLLSAGYSTRGFGVLANFRRLEAMTFRNERDEMSLHGMVNYVPANSKQHRYSLLSLHPYAGRADGEIGSQIDVYYKIKRGSFLGGKYGTKLAFNFSTNYTLLKSSNDPKDNSTDFFAFGEQNLFQDINLSVNKKFTKKWKADFVFAKQDYNKGAIDAAGGEDKIFTSYVAVADMSFKLRPKHTLRTEVQHLWSEDDQKNWLYGGLEYTFAPKLSVFVSDMYNYGDTKDHYYSAGMAYYHKSTNIRLSYGKYREGLLCEGGVCVLVPAYEGLNFTLTTSF